MAQTGSGTWSGHEEVVVRSGPRTGLPVIAALHSTVLGPATGGTRLWNYPDWRDGLADALRLSEGMTYKCAAAGLPNGGGKAVVALPPGRRLSDRERLDAMHDVGDLVRSLGGRFATGPDAGTGQRDMVAIASRTDHVFCRPESHGGSGDPSPYTALGVLHALKAACARLFGTPDLAGRSFSVVGTGHVGEHLAGQLAEAGARLVLSDTDPAKRAVAERLGAEFAEPGEALRADVDVLVPCALGGTLTADLVPGLRCSAVVGAANNQLAAPDVAVLLRDRGVLWAPDYVVNAGGVVYAVARELHREDHAAAVARVESIGATLARLFAASDTDGTSLERAAEKLALARLDTARAGRASGGPTAGPGAAPDATRRPGAGAPAAGGSEHGPGEADAAARGLDAA